MPKIIPILLILLLQCSGPLHVVIVECTGNCEKVNEKLYKVHAGGTISTTLDTVLDIESIPGGFILYSQTKGAKFYPDSIFSVYRRKIE